MKKYIGIFPEDGNEVCENDAFLYALWRVLRSEEEKKAFEEWYFSGNWYYEEMEQ